MQPVSVVQSQYTVLRRESLNQIGPYPAGNSGLLYGHETHLAHFDVTEDSLGHFSVATLSFERLVELDSLFMSLRVVVYTHGVLHQKPPKVRGTVYSNKLG